jgi:hypothetical protein
MSLVVTKDSFLRIRWPSVDISTRVSYPMAKVSDNISMLDNKTFIPLIINLY